jgi:hypothetical protein
MWFWFLIKLLCFLEWNLHYRSKAEHETELSGAVIMLLVYRALLRRAFLLNPLGKIITRNIVHSQQRRVVLVSPVDSIICWRQRDTVLNVPFISFWKFNFLFTPVLLCSKSENLLSCSRLRCWSETTMEKRCLCLGVMFHIDIGEEGFKKLRLSL